MTRTPQPSHINGSSARRADVGASDAVRLAEPADESDTERVDDNTRALWDALREVRDPELPISLVDLGLIYAIRRSGERVEVDLTFTATACPCMEFIRQDVQDRLLLEPSVREVEIREVWDPPWTSERMTEKGRAILRSFGVAA